MISPRLGGLQIYKYFFKPQAKLLTNRQNNAREAMNHPGVSKHCIVYYSSPANSMSVSWR